MPNPLQPRIDPLFTHILTAAPGFREQYLASNWENASRNYDNFGDYRARRLRYDLFWAHSENNVYRHIHQWADALKSTYQLYTFTRSIYSPAYRMGEFWAQHLMGGALDPEAGDGKIRPSCLPIIIPDGAPLADELRAAMARLFRDSNWQARKDTWTRFGAVLGDTALMIEDDPGRKKVFLRPMHPRVVVTVDRDPFGNVKGYQLQERRPDPRVADPFTRMSCVYTETAERQGERVVFTTYLNEGPWDWRDYPDDSTPRVGPQWTEDYGFIPLVFTQHRDMGLDFGWSELHPALSKMHELDDLASKLDDQIRKIVESPWFFSGVDGEEDVKITGDGDAEDGRDGGDGMRSRLPSVYAKNADAKAMPMVAPLDIAAVSAHIMTILEELERDHPELKADAAGASASGASRRIERERVERMVADRRPGYDDSLVRAVKMAISIGARKGYPGYEAFDESSFENGELDFTIGDRPVFAVDELDRLEEYQQRAAVFKTYIDGKMPMEWAARLAGIPDDVVKQITDARDKEAADAEKAAAKQQAAMFADEPHPGDGAGTPADKGGDAVPKAGVQPDGGNGPAKPPPA